MTKMSPAMVDEYFEKHLPYRTRIMLAHHKMTHHPDETNFPWTADRGPISWLQACFEASVVTGRMYLNFLGIGVNRPGTVLKVYAHSEDDDDVSVLDLGGIYVNPALLSPDERELLRGFILMANKASAHLTEPGTYDVNQTPRAILRIHHYLRTHLYDVTGRTGLEPLHTRGLGIDA